MAEPLVRAAGFSYRYPDAGSAALHEVELAIAEGEFVVLAGRSGSGKSTLLRALCGLVPHYHGGDAWGSLSVCGLDVRENGPAELGGNVGMVGQDPETQIVSATVRGELELPLELRGEPAAARARAIEEVSLALAIQHLIDRPTDTLSGGELQRVALAAALVLPLPFAFRWLDILPLGTMSAASLGVSTKTVRTLLILNCGLLTAAAALLVGPLSFIGLIAPHLARLIGLGRALPHLAGSIVLGAGLMILSDWGSRMVAFPYEMPLGLFASLVGGPYLIWLLGRQGKHAS